MSIKDWYGRPLVRMVAGETRLEDIDVTDALADDDSIASVDSATVVRQGRVVGSVLPTISIADAGVGSTIAQIQVDGGTAGETYNIDVSLTSTAGEIRIIRVAIEVEEESLVATQWPQ